MILKRPNSLMQMWGYILIIIGPIFIVSGYLNRIGILTAGPKSKVDPDLIFTATGAITLLMGLIILFTTIWMENERKNLKARGMKVEGVVVGIRKLIFTKWGTKAPYIIYFHYSRYGCMYGGKSYLVWDKPGISLGEKISIYINDDKRHQCFMDVEILGDC